MGADLIGRDDERLILDRARTDQDLPVRLPRDLGERGRQRDHSRASDREDAKELGEAKVVADGQAERNAVAGVGDDDLVARLLGGGLAVLDATDDHVEHVDLAVDGAHPSVRADVHRRVAELLASLASFDDRAGDQIDAELARGFARPGDRGPVERLGTAHVVVVLAEHVELLRKDDQVCSIGRSVPYEPVRRGHVLPLVVRRVELYGRCPHLSPLRLTDQSIQSTASHKLLGCPFPPAAPRCASYRCRSRRHACRGARARAR